MNLSAGELFITDNSATSFKVLEGSVLVFIIPFENGNAGRRILLRECLAEESIPSFCVDSDLLGSWRFGFTTLENASIETCDNSEILEESKRNFANCIGIKYLNEDTYNELVVEKYRLNLVKEEGSIYATAEEQKSTVQNTLDVMYGMFERKEEKELFASRSGNALYDAVNCICRKQGIGIASIERMHECVGKRFSLDDIARVSHFTMRNVLLEMDWFKKDVGSFLAFDEKGTPIACICRGNGNYIACDMRDMYITKVDAKLAETFKAHATMFYRPFPNKKMQLWDLLHFGIKGVSHRDVLRLVIMSILCAFVGLLLPMTNQILFDSVIPLGNENLLVEICLVVLACSLSNIAFTFVKNVSIFRSLNSVKNAIQSAVFDRLISLPESFLRKYGSGELALKAVMPSHIFSMLSSGFVRCLIGLVFASIYFVQMFCTSVRLALIAMCVSAFLFIAVGFISYRNVLYERKAVKLRNLTSSWMIQSLNGIANIRIANAENRFLYEYLKPYVELQKLECKTTWAMNIVNILVVSVQIFASILFYYFTIKDSLISVGAFLGFIASFTLFSNFAIMFLSELVSASAVIPMYDECKAILNELPESSSDMELPGKICGDIEISNVSFGYPGSNVSVLKNVSLHVAPGEYVGIVGSSGCGKSTLLKLLLGFEKPTLGKIFYDKRDIDKMDKRELRKQFGVVLQNDKLMAGSIYENITITAQNIKMERVEEVLREVGLDSDIAEMPMGLHTQLSDGLGTISGGQAERIQIARAIVNKPRVLFFDEATSALDNITQAKISSTLEKMDATRVVIAHRLSTIIKCDRIVVMDQGQIIEEGTYESLIAKKGRFYELSRRQVV